MMSPNYQSQHYLPGDGPQLSAPVEIWVEFFDVTLGWQKFDSSVSSFLSWKGISMSSGTKPQ